MNEQEQKDLAVKAMRNIAIMMAAKWAIIFVSARAARKLVAKS